MANTTHGRGAKAGHAYDYVKRRILDGSYSPGSRLVLEEISSETHMSQLPVREALRRLEAEGYVTYKHNAGARVAQLDPVTYEGTQQVVALLEGAATAAAAPLLSAIDLEQARQINEGMRQKRQDYDADGFMELNAQFHDLLCKSCPNAYLLELLASERSRTAAISRPTFGIIMKHSAEFIEDHERLLDLIAKDPGSEQIQLLAQDHKMRILRAVHDEAVVSMKA
ncbi:MAG TPA: GntR family transcriptional regulator [Pseudolysinimonas sp.]|nr:GntR family transcriptional regulator [Pseudolysinimonas sp.]